MDLNVDIYLPQLIASVIAVVVLYISRYVAHKLIEKYRLLFQKTEMRGLLIKRVISILLNIVFIFILAIIWGVQPHNLLVGLSSIFAVIGAALFAQWSILSNVTAGIIMYFSEPFRIGNPIRIIDKDIPIVGVIEDIRTFYTYIRTEEKELIAIPNNLFLQKMVSLNTPSAP